MWFVFFVELVDRTGVTPLHVVAGGWVSAIEKLLRLGWSEAEIVCYGIVGMAEERGEYLANWSASAESLSYQAIKNRDIHKRRLNMLQSLATGQYKHYGFEGPEFFLRGPSSDCWRQYARGGRQPDK
jgi:hypothetical protein